MDRGSLTAQQEAKRLLMSADAERAANCFSEAISKLERALASEGALDSPTVAEVRLRLSDCHLEMNQHEDALAVLEPLLPFAVGADDDEQEVWQGQVLALAARASFYLGDVPRAHQLALDSIELLRKQQHPAELNVAFQVLGNVLRDMGDLAEAEVAFHRSIVLAELTDDRARAASCRGSLAGLHTSQSKYRLAANEFERCAVLNEELGHRSQLARDHMNLAICQFHLGDLDDAEESVDEAHRLYGILGDSRGHALATILQTRVAARQGRDDTSSLLAQAVELASESGFRRLRLMSVEEQAEDAHRGGDLAEAERFFREMISLAKPESPGGDAVYETQAKLAQVLFERGELADAERVVTSSLEAARKSSDRRVIGCALTVLAQVLLAGGMKELAQGRIEEAIRIFGEIETPFELAQAVAVAKQLTQPEQKFVAVDPRSCEVVRTARDLWRFNGCVVIQGETGTGKEDIARLIHESGPMASAPFVVLNCAAVASEPVESEVPGYKRGTLAAAFEAAGEGTVFLDEIDKTPMHFQGRLLRTIAAQRARPLSARILCATNRDLREHSEQGGFLPELYHRLSGYVLEIPPLRDRPGDVAALTEHYAEKLVTADVLGLLRAHEWPGNVRELKNVIAGAEFSADGDAIGVGHLPSWIRPKVKPAETLPERVAELERKLVRAALVDTGGNKVQASKRLGVSRKGLIDRLKRLDMWDEFGRPRPGSG